MSFNISLHNNPISEKENFYVLGEELLCYSMLANLIKNAVEASPSKGIVTISISKENNNAILQIHNTGTVPTEIKDRFFEKYITHGKEKKGTGLGTYSAKLIAETQKGSISMVTSQEEGTTITVCLPIYMATA